MEVRWGLDELPRLLGQLGIERPFLVASDRWSQHALPIQPAVRWSEVPSDRVGAAVDDARDTDGVVALGGGSAIDLGKAVSAETGLPLVSVPTTYSGSEWTRFYGIRDRQRLARGGGGGAALAGIVYEPQLMTGLPRAETVGTALNALAHSAEALYVSGHTPEADREALAGAALISTWLPRVVASPEDAEARSGLLEGASHAGAALGSAGLGLGHAMAQALGGRYGAPHGALNAIVLPAALRFNEPVAAAEISRFGAAMDTDDADGRVVELARLGGFERLRDLGIPRDELDEVAGATAARPGARNNPRQASPAEIADLLRSVW